MSWTMYILIFAFCSVSFVTLLSCLVIAKQADETRNIIFSNSSKASAATLVFAKVTPKAPMKLVAQMPGYGVVFHRQHRG